MYDKVLTYGQIKDIGTNEHSKYVYVDVTGNPQLYSLLVAHIGKKSIQKAVSLGMSQHENATQGVGFEGLEIFFTPEWMQKRRKFTTPQEVVKMTGQAWNWLLEDCEKWVTLKKLYGKIGVAEGYKEVLGGHTNPKTALVLSLWEKDEFLSSPVQQKAKL